MSEDIPHTRDCRWFEQSEDGTLVCECGATSRVERRTPAERVIEVTIGLWDSNVPAGQNPPRLAAAIVQALHEHGYDVT